MNNKTVSLFSGGGGLDLGFKQAGYDIVWAIDNNQDAVNTYKRNVGNEIMLDTTDVERLVLEGHDLSFVTLSGDL